VPYQAIVGARETDSDTVSLRLRTGLALDPIPVRDAPDHIREAADPIPVRDAADHIRDAADHIRNTAEMG